MTADNLPRTVSNRMSNVGMSNVPCQMYLSKYQLTKKPNEHLVVGLFGKYI